MTAQAWNILGLVLVLFGILLLFRFGMPYLVPSGGSSSLLLSDTDEEKLKQENRYGILGWIGLTLTVCGTLAQIKANL